MPQKELPLTIPGVVRWGWKTYTKILFAFKYHNSAELFTLIDIIQKHKTQGNWVFQCTFGLICV